MKKAILISIKPEWVEKILNGSKPIEIRKSMPKCDLPIDVYIYCTKGKELLRQIICYYPKQTKTTSSYKIINEDYNTNKIVNGKVVAKFTLNKVDTLYMMDYHRKYGVNFLNDDHIEDDKLDKLLEKICISYKTLEDYLQPGELEKLDYGIGYLWHIENLQIFDKPMELSEFYKGNYEYIRDYVDCNNTNCPYIRYNSILGDDGDCDDYDCPRLKVNKAPQSWQYVYIGD